MIGFYMTGRELQMSLLLGLGLADHRVMGSWILQFGWGIPRQSQSTKDRFLHQIVNLCLCPRSLKSLENLQRGFQNVS